MGLAFQIASEPLVANGTIRPARFVTLVDSWSVDEATSGDAVFGISQNFPDAFNSANAAVLGEPIGVFTSGQECWLNLGGTVTGGQQLKSTTNGNGVAAGPTDPVGAIALEAGSTGQLIRVRVEIGLDIGS